MKKILVSLLIASSAATLARAIHPRGEEDPGSMQTKSNCPGLSDPSQKFETWGDPKVCDKNVWEYITLKKLIGNDKAATKKQWEEPTIANERILLLQQVDKKFSAVESLVEVAAAEEREMSVRLDNNKALAPNDFRQFEEHIVMIANNIRSK